MVKFLSECGKGPKKTFAPPIQKLHFLKPCGPKAPKEEALGASSPEAEARPNLPKARLEMNEEKTTTENGPSSGQEKKGKPQDNKQNKQAEKKEKVSVTLMGSVAQLLLACPRLDKRNRFMLGKSIRWLQIFCSFSGASVFFSTR